MGKIYIFILTAVIGFFFTGENAEAHMHGGQHQGHECVMCANQTMAATSKVCCDDHSFSPRHRMAPQPVIGRDCSCDSAGCCTSASHDGTCTTIISPSPEHPVDPPLDHAFRSVILPERIALAIAGRSPPIFSAVPSFLRHCALLI